MNSLEFTENKIKGLKQWIKETNKRIEEYKNYPSLLELQICMKENLEIDLTYFQQIKSELEAWNVVKWSISKEHLEDSQIRTMFGENPFMNITEEEKLIVEKALEVKDNVD